MGESDYFFGVGECFGAFYKYFFGWSGLLERRWGHSGQFIGGLVGGFFEFQGKFFPSNTARMNTIK